MERSFWGRRLSFGVSDVRFHLTTLLPPVSDPVDLPEHGVTTVFVQLENTKFELLHPLGKDSPIASFLAKNPKGGIHHCCIEGW